jgi:hypothetical protein
MSSRKICVSIFDEHTKEQFLQHPTIFGHNKRVHCVGKGDIVVCYNLTTREIFAIGILRAIDGNNIYRKTHPIDQDLYTEEYKQYTQYEIGVHIFPIEPISLATVNERCGLERNTPIMPCRPTSFKMINHISPWVTNALLDAFIQNI